MSLEDKINEMKQWPTCANVSPRFLAGILQELLKRCHMKYIGSFKSAEEAERAAASVQHAADRNAYALIFDFIYGTSITGVIYQTIVGNVCAQTLVSGVRRAYRNVTFTDETLTSISSVGDWVIT